VQTDRVSKFAGAATRRASMAFLTAIKKEPLRVTLGNHALHIVAYACTYEQSPRALTTKARHSQTSFYCHLGAQNT